MLFTYWQISGGHRQHRITVILISEAGHQTLTGYVTYFA